MSLSRLKRTGKSQSRSSPLQKHKQFLSLSICGISMLALSSTFAAEPVEFSLPDLTGKQQKLSDFRGKWVLVNYWATWCPPCISEIPELVEFHEAHKDKDAVVIGVDFEDIGSDELREFVESYFMSYPILRMKPAPKSPLGVISGLPTSFLINPQGQLVARQTGPVTSKLIEEFIYGSQDQVLPNAASPSSSSQPTLQQKQIASDAP